uniref:methylenetetrahydrofolate reductase n=1 Tax=Endozoicomonas sp. ONNA2 TaxID=2828741 RepID=UPI0021492628
GLSGHIRDPEEVVTRLCEKLLQGGAPGLHFYTLNQADPCRGICDNLGILAD